MEERLRKSGIGAIGDVPRGTHFCQLYEAGQSLLDTLVPYFRAGLEYNESCIWVTAQPVGVEDAKPAMRRAVSDIDRYLEKGQLEIFPHNVWYLKEGVFDLQGVLDGWVERLDRALARGMHLRRQSGFWNRRRIR